MTKEILETLKTLFRMLKTKPLKDIRRKYEI